MSYDELCKSIGIDREAITRACAEPPSTAVGKERLYVREDVSIGPRVKPPIEDVSRLIDEYGQTISRRLRKPTTNKPK